MKTAIELAEDKPSSIDDDLYAWATEAAAMLLKQAEQIEALTKERDGAYVQSLQFSEENEALLKANLDCVDHFNTLKTDYDALKADAERIRECASRLVEHADFRLGGILSADSKAKDIPSRATSQVKARHLAALRDALKPIDSMKGKS